MSAEQLILIAAAPFIGSFLGVLVLRLPDGRSILLDRSTCDGCGKVLAPADLVPLISYLWRRGRCGCGAIDIGPFYPAIELAALGVVVLAAMVSSGWLLWVSAALGWTLLTLAAIDWREQILPDLLTLPMIPAGLLLAWWLDRVDLLDHVVGAVVGYSLLLAINAGYRRLRGRDGLGGGDAKLLAAAGSWLGWHALPNVVLIAALSALLVAAGRAAFGAAVTASSRIAFGPYLALAFWLLWLMGLATAR